MVMKVVKVRYDDLTVREGQPEEGAQEVHFGIDGMLYAIDLTDDNRQKLEAVLEPFIEHARLGKARDTRSERQRRLAKTADNAKIRKWARENRVWHSERDRGLIPQWVINKYREAHGMPVMTPAAAPNPLPRFSG